MRSQESYHAEALGSPAMEERDDTAPTGMPEDAPEGQPLGPPETEPDGDGEPQRGADAMPGIPPEGEPPSGGQVEPGRETCMMSRIEMMPVTSLSWTTTR